MLRALMQYARFLAGAGQGMGLDEARKIFEPDIGREVTNLRKMRHMELRRSSKAHGCHAASGSHKTDIRGGE
jgi:hypothetical protein